MKGEARPRLWHSTGQSRCGGRTMPQNKLVSTVLIELPTGEGVVRLNDAELCSPTTSVRKGVSRCVTAICITR